MKTTQGISFSVSSHIHTSGYTPKITFLTLIIQKQGILKFLVLYYRAGSWILTQTFTGIQKSGSEVGAPIKRILLSTVTIMTIHG
jgi:hypothetical protein